MSDYLDAVRRGVVIFDGGAGTWLQGIGLGADDYGGRDLDGCAEVLNVTRPDVIEGLHRSFLDVGVDAVETNTFGGFAVTLGEYGISDRAYELSAAGAAIARRTVDEYVERDDRPRLVAGSVGPGTKSPTMGQITYRDADALRRAVATVPMDRLLVETDCPFLTPQPKRSRVSSNEPAYVVHTAQMLAELKDVSFDEVCVRTTENAMTAFGLDVTAEGGRVRQ